MKRVIVVIAAALAVVVSGCAQAGSFTAGNLTTVELSQPNFEIVATGVAGQSTASYAIGVTVGNGESAGSLSLFRLGGTGQLYQEALADLWASFEAEHGSAEERRLALTNIRYDSDTRNLLVWSDIKLSIRADVIEFTD